MMRRLAGLMFLSLAGCGPQTEPTAVHYDSYDDCLLDKLGRGQTNAAVAIIVQACKSKYKTGAPSDLIAPEDQDGLATRHHDGEEGGNETFPGAAMTPGTNATTFHGAPCTDDCSGHEAGYEWAEENGITDPDNCGGDSHSFIEGCEAWAEENS